MGMGSSGRVKNTIMRSESISNSEVGALNSYTKTIPTATNASTVDRPSSSDQHHHFQAHNMMQASSFKFPSLIFDQVDRVVDRIQSPERCLWELFADQLLESGDFMISSPQLQADNHNYGEQEQSTLKSLMVPGPQKEKGKGLSPVLHEVFNSPNAQYNNYMQVESLSLPALHEFLDDLEKDGDHHPDHGPVILSEEIHDDVNGIITSSSDCCFHLSTVPELLDCLQAMPNSSNSSRFCTTAGSNTTNGLRSTHQQQPNMINIDIDVVYDELRPDESNLLQQLEQERQQEKKQQREREVQPYLHDHPTRQLHQEQQDSGLRLVHLLLACAEAVAKEEYMLGRRYLHHLNRVVTPLGDSMQRVASCFAEALAARLAAALTTSTATANNPFPDPSNSLEILNIYQILYQACTYIKFAHFTANQAIFEAFEAEERVHVIDLDILQGYQWPAFMQALAARPGGAPFLRITGVGPSPDAVRDTGRCLTELAHSLHIPFEFHPVGERLQDLKPHMFHRRVGEALAVNSVSRLHRVPPNFLGNLLGMIRDQAPNIVTIVEQEASHNGPCFLGRFLEALHYYSAVFDSLDATFPRDSAQRAKLEQYIFDVRNGSLHHLEF